MLPKELLYEIEDCCDIDTLMQFRKALGWEGKKLNLEPFEKMYDKIPKPMIRQNSIGEPSIWVHFQPFALCKEDYLEDNLMW